ncbi:CAP domain-containing protein [Chitinophaga agrisoli]|uniref:CAP domain-containing protein n=1 Tax=Chitinophaga agrisoli TaxID=2607653 RepID=A0A5B2W441_9BACT|nr:CAP domain-containing protein [Chitinophaga agrisoli]KAA2245039.1 CAP domain-containing protein [Chitinophaga agrisoli]
MTGFLRFVALICLPLSVICCTKDATNTPITPGDTAPVTDSFPENKVDRTALLRLVNGLRSRGCTCGDTKMPPVGPLTWNGTLEKAAWLHSKDMNDQQYFDHIAPNGSNPGQRLDALGYRWTTYGENIATGTFDEQNVILGWLSSPKHCQNMMGASFHELGIGKYEKYWTMELGTTSK